MAYTKTNWQNGATPAINAENLNHMEQGIYDAHEIGLVLFPVGSIYMSVNDVNPGTFIGGTWVKWGSGKVPVGVDTSQTEFNASEKTGGSKTHQLKVNELPSHYHTIDGPSREVNYSTGAATVGTYDTESSGTEWTSSVGGNQAHNNLQPYITCYMWKRTA